MRRYVVAAILLAVAAITITVGDFIGSAVGSEPPPRYEEWSLLPTTDQLVGWGWSAVFITLPVVPVVHHLAVLVAWAWQPIAARRALAARIEREKPLLDNYGHGELHERRFGQGFVRPDAVVNQAA